MCTCLEVKALVYTGSVGESSLRCSYHAGWGVTLGGAKAGWEGHVHVLFPASPPQERYGLSESLQGSGDGDRIIGHKVRCFSCMLPTRV